MSRRWLLTMLTGTALTFGVAATAGAQELGSDPIVVDAEVATVTLTADSAEQTLEAELETDVALEDAETEVAPTATVEVSPEGPAAELEGPVTVGGEELPIPQVVAPVDEVAEEQAAGPAPTQSQAAAGSGISAAPAPAEEERSVRHSSTITADRAAYRSGFRSDMAPMDLDASGILSPEIAPPAETLPLVAAAAPTATTDLALPVIDTTPTVPGLLRLLAGLLVVGAAATWRTVRDELA